MSRNLVTIIIPCFNAIEYTIQCLDSVLEHTNINYELFLINNGSVDGTKKYFNFLKKNLTPTKYLKKITILQFKKNLGVAKSLNLGISKSIGNYVCYLNNDVIVTKDWLKKIVRVAKNDKKIGAVGTMFNSFLDKKIIKQVEKNKNLINKISSVISITNSNKIKQTNLIHGLCMFIKKSTLKKIGYFNENFYPCFGEDIEFCERLKKNGYKLVDAMDVYIFHFWHKSVRSKEFNDEYNDIRSIIKAHKQKYSIKNIIVSQA